MEHEHEAYQVRCARAEERPDLMIGTCWICGADFVFAQVPMIEVKELELV